MIRIGGALRLRPSHATVREVALTCFDQGRQIERFEGVGESRREGLLRAIYQGPRPLPAVLRKSPETPSAMSAARDLLMFSIGAKEAARSRNRTERVRAINTTGVSQKRK
jgi:hypothetical protein